MPCGPAKTAEHGIGLSKERVMRTRLFVLAAALTFLSASGLVAQHRGTLTGIVTDAQGTALPGVTVELTGPDNRKGVSDAQGRFTFGLLAPGVGLKAGVHQWGATSDPDEEGAPDPAVVDWTSDWVTRRFRDVDPRPLSAETCFDTTTPDESFVLERHDRIVVGSACSGHGFKFAPVIGQRLAHLAAEALD